MVPTQAASLVDSGAVSGLNDYSWGNCTYGVASWISVPGDLGNANMWAYNANSEGFSVSNIPRVGAVAQTTVGYLGHVAEVIAVDGDTVTVKEMNYNGLGVVDERTTPVSDWTYIYF